MNLKECNDTLCDLLKRSGYEDEADEIQALVDIVLDPNSSDSQRNEAIKNLTMRCHPKWLGDFFIDGMTYPQWTDLITHFEKLLNRQKRP